jgi:phosphonate transport system substrate-binding protein
MRGIGIVALLGAVALLAAGCGESPADGDEPTLLIGGIPDQDRTFLEERFGAVADHLSEQVGIPVAYQPSSDYAAVVTAFRGGDIQLGWFGGLTGVQARAEVDGAEAIAQRELDANFHSVVIASPDLGADGLTDLAGAEFTFGSESSTSGHLMPRHELVEAGIDPESDFATVSYSGSHDTTAKLVESGSFDAGALNEQVWDRLVADGELDTDRVEVVGRVGPYSDYSWGAHPDIDRVYGEGTTEAVTEALLSMHETEAGREILEMFDAERFIPTENANYETIEQVARELEMIE